LSRAGPSFCRKRAFSSCDNSDSEGDKEATKRRQRAVKTEMERWKARARDLESRQGNFHLPSAFTSPAPSPTPSTSTPKRGRGRPAVNPEHKGQFTADKLKEREKQRKEEVAQKEAENARDAGVPVTNSKRLRSVLQKERKLIEKYRYQPN
jgi:hypothetical protein